MTSADRPARLARVSELSTEVESELEKRQSPATVLDQMRKSALADLRKELAGLAEVLGTTHHRLIFIGRVSVGKTTAICHLVGLTAERDKKKPTKADPERVIRVTEDMMATGSGFTTLCEVVVKPGDTNKFEIDPYPREEVERTIDDFCMNTWVKVYPDSFDGGQKGSGGEPPSFPSELVRAVRNMVKLPSGDRKEDDAAIKLAREFKKDEFEQFQARVVELAKLEARNQTTFVCPSLEPDPKAWIKKTFDELNLARLDTVSIPRQITLHVDAKLLSPHMSRVSAVVDTRGVDASQFNREDLDRHIRDDKSALCVLSERFGTVPTEVAPLLARHVTPEQPLSLSKFVLLVIPRGSEPENTQAESGPIGDREKGIEYRRMQVEETLTGRGINGMNLLFYDPLHHFDATSENRMKPDSNLADIQAERDDVWKAFSEAIEQREDKVWARVEQISESLRKIREGKGLNETEETLVKDTRPKIAEYRHVPLTNADRFLEEYRALWDGPAKRPAPSLRATNNRFGVYPHKDIDIYYDAVPITEALVRKAYSGSKEAVLGIIRAVNKSSKEGSELRALLGVLEKRVDSSFEEMVRAVAAHMQDYLSKTVFFPPNATNQFWNEVQGRYGKGSGYRDDVLTMYEDQLDGNEEELKTVALAHWQTLVIDPVLEYLR